MQALMDLLGKDPKDPQTSDVAGPDDASDDAAAASFDQGAEEVMHCLKTGDLNGFSDALKACIEMAQK